MKRDSIVETPYQRVEVWKSEHACEFRVAGAVHAVWDRRQLLTGLAWDNLAAGCLLRSGGPPASVLMLGLAGGTTFRILRHLLPESEFTAVEIDREMIHLARSEMELDRLHVDIEVGEAYEWAQRCGRRWDAVIDDCYFAGETDVYRSERNPSQSFTPLVDLLNPGGVLLMNLVTGSGHRNVQSRMRAAFKRTFPAVRTIRTHASLNETLVGSQDLLSGKNLDSWTDSFPNRADRELWARLEERRLS